MFFTPSTNPAIKYHMIVYGQEFLNKKHPCQSLGTDMCTTLPVLVVTTKYTSADTFKFFAEFLKQSKLIIFFCLGLPVREIDFRAAGKYV